MRPQDENASPKHSINAIDLFHVPETTSFRSRTRDRARSTDPKDTGGRHGTILGGYHDHLRPTLRLAAPLAATAGRRRPAAAQDLSEGETVEYMIPFSESGGSAKWANFFAPLLAKRCPAARPSWSAIVPAPARPRARTGSSEPGYRRRHAGLRRFRLHQVPVPAGRPARALRVYRVAAGAGLGHRRRRLPAAGSGASASTATWMI